MNAEAQVPVIIVSVVLAAVVLALVLFSYRLSPHFYVVMRQYYTPHSTQRTFLCRDETTLCLKKINCLSLDLLNT